MASTVRVASFLGIAAAVASISFAQTENSITARVGDVTWPDESPSSVSGGEKIIAGAEKTFLPVLVPESFFDFVSRKFVGEDSSYLVMVTAKGATLSITGTRLAFDEPGVRPTKPSQTPSEITVDQGERSASAGYVRFGAAYRVDVECDGPSDKRCADGAYARRLLESVVLAGGAQGQPAQPQPDEPDTGPSAVSSAKPPADFAKPPGELLPRSGKGVTSTTIFAPSIRFPVETPPAYLNSQVWGVGGLSGPRGSASDPRNYQYPWRDNFCESRSRATPMCPSGTGHQGQDIRPGGPGVAKYWAVAAESGKIRKIGSYSVILIGSSGTEYRYLHLAMHQLAVKLGDNVMRGQRIGLISNDFGNTKTTVHLHFEMLQNRNGKGLRHVPPYSSLVASYVHP
ncbi:M23 family metallopeptidase [Sphingobium sp. PAMC28499]|uniref:M23 family metallopeptidase n=1 Tax=Sphingobium sp. PAMC28499 TaxID=2565554 RepID=UPI00109E169F|nr:M23 family metallopeptidase [Sphingobium sp. PAMC28499]QCB38965.1 M23 family metallopeptidase [Sphingobium sp. PAMC28499]